MSDEKVEFKGSIVRGYAKWLRDNGQLDRVIERASPEAKRVLLDPPLVSEWVSAATQFAVLDAVHAVGGDALLRSLIKGAMSSSVLKLLEPLIQGVVRVFGRSPTVLLSRLGSIRKNAVHGVDFDYRAEGESAGHVVARSLATPLSPHSALAWAATIESVCVTLGFDKVRTEHEISADRMRATIHVRW
ncbi:MAG: hypothetical protein U0269_33575 [Polyangiales bacterium]